MTFTILATAVSLLVGLVGGWLASWRVGLYLRLAGGNSRTVSPARIHRLGATARLMPEHPGLVATMVAGAFLLSVTHPPGNWSGWGHLQLLWCAALPLAWIDLRTQLIDTPWLVGMLVLQLVLVAILERPLLLSMLGGMLLATGFFHILAVVYETLRHRSGLGDGDPAVAGLLGAFVGVDGILPLIALSAVSGLVGGTLWLLLNRRGWRDPIPFAPFLVLSGVVIALGQTHGVAWPRIAF